MDDSFITERDIERVAEYLARERNGEARKFAQARADDLSQNGEREAAAIWSRIVAALG